MTTAFKIFHDLYSVWRIRLVGSRSSDAGYFKCKDGALHNHQRDSPSVFPNKYLFVSTFLYLINPYNLYTITCYLLMIFF